MRKKQFDMRPNNVLNGKDHLTPRTCQCFTDVILFVVPSGERGKSSREERQVEMNSVSSPTCENPMAKRNKQMNECYSPNPLRSQNLNLVLIYISNVIPSPWEVLEPQTNLNPNMLHHSNILPDNIHRKMEPEVVKFKIK